MFSRTSRYSSRATLGRIVALKSNYLVLPRNLASDCPENIYNYLGAKEFNLTYTAVSGVRDILIFNNGNFINNLSEINEYFKRLFGALLTKGRSVTNII